MQASNKIQNILANINKNLYLNPLIYENVNTF